MFSTIYNKNHTPVHDIPESKFDKGDHGCLTCCLGGAVFITLLVLGILGFHEILPVAQAGAYAMTIIGGVGFLATLIAACCCCSQHNPSNVYN